jgi:hypothetical protein
MFVCGQRNNEAPGGPGKTTPAGPRPHPGAIRGARLFGPQILPARRGRPETKPRNGNLAQARQGNRLGIVAITQIRRRSPRRGRGSGQIRGPSDSRQGWAQGGQAGVGRKDGCVTAGREPGPPLLPESTARSPTNQESREGSEGDEGRQSPQSFADFASFARNPHGPGRLRFLCFLLCGGSDSVVSGTLFSSARLTYLHDRGRRSSPADANIAAKWRGADREASDGKRTRFSEGKPPQPRSALRRKRTPNRRPSSSQKQVGVINGPHHAIFPAGRPRHVSRLHPRMGLRPIVAYP